MSSHETGDSALQYNGCWWGKSLLTKNTGCKILYLMAMSHIVGDAVSHRCQITHYTGDIPPWRLTLPPSEVKLSYHLS